MPAKETSNSSSNSPRALAEARKRARRVPEESRKRGIQSCDLCRKKRCKCIAAAGQRGLCLACQSLGVECTYNAPRKTRIYGNVNDLGDRFRCLEALVRGAFPGEPLNSTAELIALGLSRGYDMPDLSEGAESGVEHDQLKQNGSNAHTAHPDSHIKLPSSVPSASGVRLVRDRSSSHKVETPRPLGFNQQEHSPAVSDTPSLVRDTSGREHYIGPTGGLQFLGQLRRILISRDERPGLDDTPPLDAGHKFTEDDGAHALEVDEPQETNPDTDPDAQLNVGAVATQDDHLTPVSNASGLTSSLSQKPHSTIEEYWLRFPPLDTVEKALQSYFQNVHEDFPLFHRATFEDDYEAHLRHHRAQAKNRETPKIDDLDLGWLGCLHMTLVFGSRSDTSIDGNQVRQGTLRRHHVSVTRSLLPHLVSKCTLNNLRALLLLALWLHNNNERNATWNLVGTATRIAFALGLHREDTGSSFRAIDRETRKRVFCTLYGFEQFLASSLGRPSGLSDVDVQVIPPREGILDCGGGGDASCMGFTLRLHRILGRTRTSAASNSSEALPTRERNALAFLQELREWRTEASKQQWLNVPSVRTGFALLDESDNASSMNFDELKTVLGWQSRPRLRAALLLRLQYHYVALLITRPFLLEELSDPAQSSPSPPATAAAASVATTAAPNPESADSSREASPPFALADICLRHAAQLALTILLLDNFSLVNGVAGLDIFYIYWACMILSLGMLHRGAAFQEPGTTEALSNLVSRLREVAEKTEKSGTMKRFTKLMGAFADYVGQRNAPGIGNGTGPHHHHQQTVSSGATATAHHQRSEVAGHVIADPQVRDTGVNGMFWSHAVMPIGNTIEGGIDMDGPSSAAFGSAIGNEWMGFLLAQDTEMNMLGDFGINPYMMPQGPHMDG